MPGLRKPRLLWGMTMLLATACGSGQAIAQSAAVAAPTTAPTTQPVEVIYVFSPTCLYCREASKSVEAAVRRYGPKIRVQRVNIQEADGLERVLALEARFTAAAAAPPRVFVGSRYLTGLDAISRGLGPAIDEELKAAATSQPDRGPTTRPAPGASVTQPPKYSAARPT